MENKFEFSESKEGFDIHIIKSIPGYDVLVEQTTILANHWLNEDALPVIDIGGSTGKLLNLIQKKNDIKVKNKFFNIDPTTFEDKISNQYITFINDDAQNYLKTVKSPVQLFFSIFTLQFLSSSNRALILSQISEKLSADGAFIIAEKFYMQDSEYQELYSVVLRDIKRDHFSDSSILDKDKKLLKHLKLKKECEFQQEMSDCGFKTTKYWQSLHFNAFICVRK